MSKSVVYQLGRLKMVAEKLAFKRSHAVATIFCTSSRLIDETIDWYFKLGFDHILLFVNQADQVRAHDKITHFAVDDWSLFNRFEALNTITRACDETWIYWGYNAEFFYYPYADDRGVKELIEFSRGERRDSLYTYIIDAYPEDINSDFATVGLKNTRFDKDTYFAECLNPVNKDDALAVNLDPERGRHFAIFGGLRWRYSRHLNSKNPRIDRPAFFETSKDLLFDKDGRTTRAEFHAMHAETHDSPILAVVSFQVIHALLENPATRDRLSEINWQGSRGFDWTAKTLLHNRYLMPGQWY